MNKALVDAAVRLIAAGLVTILHAATTLDGPGNAPEKVLAFVRDHDVIGDTYEVASADAGPGPLALSCTCREFDGDCAHTTAVALVTGRA